MRPGDGAKLTGSSALMRNSMACPCGRTCARFGTDRRLPDAIRSCSRMRSMPVTSSVTGCSTWMRVFISMK